MATVLPSSAGQTTEVPEALPSTAIEPPPLEQRVLLRNVSWDTYERLIEETNNPGTRMRYDEGLLEITSPRERHERFNELLGRLVEIVAEELGMTLRSTGSTTWKRERKKKGLEADTSYYLTNAPKVRGKPELDLIGDPPPDLAIEVENTSSAIDQLFIYAALGVPEVWRFDGERLTIHSLQRKGHYSETAESRFLPAAALPKMVEWVGKGDDFDEIVWMKEFRRWVRENLVKSR